MNAIQIKDGIYWVGALDWHLRNFHGYTTNRGATYNAYLIIDEKVALIDTVKAPFSRELLERIRSIIDPSRIDYIISNHVEMDHSGALPALMEAWRATFWPWAAVRMQPNMTSSTCSGFTPARFRASLMTMAPRSAAGVFFSAPPKEPIAVLQQFTT